MRRFALLLAVVALAACQDNGDGEDPLSLPATETNVTGTFSLVYANTRPLPFDAIVTSAEVWTLTSDRIVLAANGTWADTTRYQVTNRSSGAVAPQTTTSAGTWEIANQQINFTMTTGGSVAFVGAVYQNNLAVNFSGQRYVYTR